MEFTFDRASRVMEKFFSVTEGALKQAFRPARKEELPAVSELRQRIFGDSIRSDDDVKYMYWRYFERKGFGSTLWVFVLDGKLLGVVGEEPVEIVVKSPSGEVELYSAVRNMDAAVNPDVNGSGLGAWMTLAMQNMHETVIVTGGNANSISMLSKLFRSLPVRHYFKILLHSKSFLEKKLPSLLVLPIASLLDIYFKIKLNHASNARLPNGYCIEQLSVDAFLDRYAGNFNDGLGSVKVCRSTDYYRWRLASSDQFSYRVVAAFFKEQMLGYLIFATPRIHGTDSEGYLFDWDVRKSSESELLLSVLMAKATQQCAIEGADSVTCILNEKYSIRAASKAGFVNRDTKSTFFVHSSNQECLHAISDPDRWIHTLIDSDTLRSHKPTLS